MEWNDSLEPISVNGLFRSYSLRLLWNIVTF